MTKWIGQLRRREVLVFLPKFKVETSYRMKKTLQSMGMVRAFKDPRLPEGADFTGMTGATSPTERLFIAAVLHKASVEVNEKGTEATAATAALIMPLCMVKEVPFVPTFKADRPFIYVIQDRRTGSILFLGRMMHPKAEGPGEEQRSDSPGLSRWNEGLMGDDRTPQTAFHREKPGGA